MSGLRVASILCVGLILAGCANYQGPIPVNRTACVVLGAAAGGGTGGAISNDNENDHYDINWSIAGGAVAGAALGYLLCGDATPPQGPTARASAEPNSGNPPLSTQLRAVGSDADGEIVSYEWDFGDGTKGSGKDVSHTYSSPGEYRAVVTVTDDDGMTASATAPVRVVAKAAAPPPPAPVARKIVLRGVNFDFDKADIRPDAQVILDAAVEVLSENKGVSVQVGGHTDATGPDAYNQGLSERRASAVSDYLSKNGVSASRLSVTGHGESSPVADNSTKDGRAQNRRVELNVVQ